LGRAKADEEGRVTLYVHTYAREDALILYGFASESDRTAFRTLIGLSNVGPKTALAVLTALPYGELATVIAAKDVAQLTRIPGIGKKTAERLVLELRDRLPTRADAPGVTILTDAKGTPKTNGGQRELLVGALTRMGYRPVEADRAADALASRLEAETFPNLVREALAFLAK
jgi:Holliday junction DNA helicase RuvA